MSRPKLVRTRPTGHGRARGLVSNRASGDRVRAGAYAPPPDLEELVVTFWTGRWDLRGEEPHETHMLSDPCVHVVFEEGDNQPGARVVGVWTKLWKRRLSGRGSVRGVKLRAGRLRALFDLPASKLRDRILPLAELIEEPVEPLLVAALQKEDEEAFFSLAEWLRGRRREDPAGAIVAATLERIRDDPSITTAERLAEVAGYDLRSLQRLFRAHLGAPPKWAIRRNRLQEAALRIESGEAPRLAALAAALGYTDQAHLARDFKGAVGKSPSAFAASVHAPPKRSRGSRR